MAERPTSNEGLTLVGERILAEAQKGEKSLFDIFKEKIVPKINYGPQKKAGTYTPAEALQIAMGALDQNYHHSELNFGIIMIYSTLGLKPSNAVEKLRPFIEGPHTEWILRNRLFSASLAIAEDYLGLKRDVLYDAFSIYKEN